MSLVPIAMTGCAHTAFPAFTIDVVSRVRLDDPPFIASVAPPKISSRDVVVVGAPPPPAIVAG